MGSNLFPLLEDHAGANSHSAQSIERIDPIGAN